MLRGTMYKLGDDGDIITVEVKNVLIQKKIHNVFGVINGYTDTGIIFCFKQLCASNNELVPATDHLILVFVLCFRSLYGDWRPARCMGPRICQKHCWH